MRYQPHRLVIPLSTIPLELNFLLSFSHFATFFYFSFLIMLLYILCLDVDQPHFIFKKMQHGIKSAKAQGAYAIFLL